MIIPSSVIQSRATLTLNAPAAKYISKNCFLAFFLCYTVIIKNYKIFRFVWGTQFTHCHKNVNNLKKIT